MEFFSKITFFSCIPVKLVVVSFPKASAKLQGLFQTTKFFSRKFSENFSARSAKTFYAPYSQRVKAHKIFFARRALFCSYKGAGPASLSGRKRKSRPFIAIRQIFQRDFYDFMPLNIKSPHFFREFSSSPPTVPYFKNSCSKLGGSEKFFGGSEFVFRAAEFFFRASPNFLESQISILTRELAIFMSKKDKKRLPFLKKGGNVKTKKRKEQTDGVLMAKKW